MNEWSIYLLLINRNFETAMLSRHSLVKGTSASLHFDILLDVE